MIDNGFFQINDIVLNIPPTQIKINRSSYDHRLENLRSVGASVIKSKFSELGIQVSTVFTGNQKEIGDGFLPGGTGLNKLQNLIAQFRTTPFCYVKNKFLSESIFSQGTLDSMTLAIRNINISAAGGDSIDAVKVTFSFNYFNHTPYIDEFRYRRSVFLPINENTLDPSESGAWKMFYEAEKKRREQTGSPYTPVHTLSEPTTGEQVIKTKMTYRQFRMFRAPELKRIREEIRALKTTSNQSTYDAFKDDIDSRYDVLGNASDAFPQNEDLSNNYRIATVKETVDRMRYELETTMCDAGGVYLTESELIAKSRRWEIFAESLPEQWEAVILKDGNFSVLSSENQKTTDVMNAAESSASNDLILCTKNKELDLEQTRLNPIGISINFSNRLVPIPLISSMYPTYQHMGGMDVTASMSFLTTSNEDVEELARFHTMWKEQRMYMRSIPASFRKVVIQNDILNMCGLHSFMLQNMEISTVPGQPETKQIIFDLMENAKPDFSEEKLVYEEVRQGYLGKEYGPEVFKWMNSFLLRSRHKNAHPSVRWGNIFSEDIIGGKVSLKSWVRRKHWSPFSPFGYDGEVRMQLLKDKETGALLSQGVFAREPAFGDAASRGTGGSLFTPNQQPGFINPQGLLGMNYSTTESDTAQFSTSEVSKHVIYTLDLYASTMGRVFRRTTGDEATHAAKHLLSEFNIIFSEFVMDILDYRQGVEEHSATGIMTAGVGGSITDFQTVNEDLQFVNIEAHQAELVLDNLTNANLLGIEEADYDSYTILKDAERGTNNKQFRRGGLGWLTTQIDNARVLIEDRDYYKGESDSTLIEKWTREFFGLDFVLKYQVRLKTLIDRVLNEEVFLNLPEFKHIKEEILERKSTIGSTAYPDFPLNELLDVIGGIKQKGPQFLEDLKSKLKKVNDEFVPGSKVVSLDTFFGPDFYLCQPQVSQDSLLNKSELIAASEAIQDAFESTKVESVGGWLKDVIDNARPKDAKKIYDELTKTHKFMGIDQDEQIGSLRARWVDNQQLGKSVQNAGSQRKITPWLADKDDKVKHWMSSKSRVTNRIRKHCWLVFRRFERTRYSRIRMANLPL